MDFGRRGWFGFFGLEFILRGDFIEFLRCEVGFAGCVLDFWELRLLDRRGGCWLGRWCSVPRLLLPWSPHFRWTAGVVPDFWRRGLLHRQLLGGLSIAERWDGLIVGVR